jgi:signal transduction histidine kinase
VLLFDRELRCILVDGQGLAPSGMEKAHIEGYRLTDAMPPNTHHSLVPLFRAALEGHTSSIKLTVNGGTHQIHVLPIIEADNTITAGMVMSQNITDQVRMETALRAERNLFVGGPAVVFKWAAEPGWPVEYVSPNVQEQFGYPPTAFTSGQIKYADIVYPADLRRIAPTPSAYTHPDMPTSEQEYRIADSKGDFRWIYDYTIVLYDDNGNPTHLHGYLLDITQRKHAEQELAKHRDQLEDLVNERTAELQAANAEMQTLTRLKDEFVSNVSHELRTPITNLKLYQKLIRENPGKTDTYLAVLQRETDRLHLIIENLLNLSRLDQDRVKPRFVCTNLNTLIAEYAEDRAPLIKRQGLTLALETASAPLMVRADPDLLGQVLSILLTNAVNYTPSGGRITLRTLSQIDGTDALAGFCVIDTGQGIPPEDLERLFERFYRGQIGLQSGKPGTGLGLAIAEEIIDRHNGYIEAANVKSPQTGAMFTAWLPLLDP